MKRAATMFAIMLAILLVSAAPASAQWNGYAVTAGAFNSDDGGSGYNSVGIEYESAYGFLFRTGWANRAWNDTHYNGGTVGLGRRYGGETFSIDFGFDVEFYERGSAPKATYVDRFTDYRYRGDVAWHVADEAAIVVGVSNSFRDRTMGDNTQGVERRKTDGVRTTFGIRFGF